MDATAAMAASARRTTKKICTTRLGRLLSASKSLEPYGILKENMKIFIVSILKRLFAGLQFFELNGKSNQEIFSKIYKHKTWGTSESDHLPFNSGGGSVELEVIDPYIIAVQKFVACLPNRIAAVDLGCGDFRVGSRLVNFFERYIACDVVEELLEFNRGYYRYLPVEFRLLDLTIDPIPLGDLLIVRQVLQHLSNKDISRFLRRIPKEFCYLLVTEHLPEQPNFKANLDQETGPGTRLSINSGVVLTEEPFNLIVQHQETLLSLPSDGGLIVTTLYKI
jgi:hypothetical protein